MFRTFTGHFFGHKSAKLKIRTDTDTTLGSVRCPDLFGAEKGG